MNDHQFRQVNRFMAAFIVLPILAYGIIRMLFAILAA